MSRLDVRSEETKYEYIEFIEDVKEQRDNKSRTMTNRRERIEEMDKNNQLTKDRNDHVYI